MVFKVPIALVSLVDTDRQWFKSAQGLGNVCQTDRKSSFCAWCVCLFVWLVAAFSFSGGVAGASSLQAGRRFRLVTLPQKTNNQTPPPQKRTLLPKQPGVLVVENAATDARFAANALVTGPPHIRFYAGAPLITASGVRLGSLCVLFFLFFCLFAVGRPALVCLRCREGLLLQCVRVCPA